MRILLLGKFPPAQGGISAKTYWLARTLAATGISFDIVTIAPPSYRTAAPATAPPDLRQRICEAEASPWFLPGGDLCTEHVITEALVLAAERAPDAIEANYLAPFGIAALVAARLLGVPLIIRHAGSDIAKLLDWPPARGALRALLGAANLVLTTPDARPRLEDLTPSRRLLALPRYAPDPAAFAWRPPISSRLLLIAGKLNYHWRLKGLDVLLEALALRPEWRVLSVVDGCGREDFAKEVDRLGLAPRFAWRPLAPPDAMPDLIGEASAVWAVARADSVPDFSNLVWEAAAIGRPCLVSPAAASHPDARPLLGWPGLVPMEPDDPAAVAAALDRAGAASVPRPDGLEERFAGYVESNRAAYLSIGGGRP